MANHCVYIKCDHCGEEYCIRCEVCKECRQKAIEAKNNKR